MGRSLHYHVCAVDGLFGEPTSPPLIHHARDPPQFELTMGTGGGQAEEVAWGSSPDDLDQS